MRIQSANGNGPSEKILARLDRCLWQLEIYESPTCSPCRSKRGSCRRRNVDQTQNPLSVAMFSWNVEWKSGRTGGWGSDCESGFEWNRIWMGNYASLTLVGPEVPVAAAGGKSHAASSGASSSSALACTRSSRPASTEIYKKQIRSRLN